MDALHCCPWTLTVTPGAHLMSPRASSALGSRCFETYWWGILSVICYPHIVIGWFKSFIYCSASSGVNDWRENPDNFVCFLLCRQHGLVWWWESIQVYAKSKRKSFCSSRWVSPSSTISFSFLELLIVPTVSYVMVCLILNPLHSNRCFFLVCFLQDWLDFLASSVTSLWKWSTEET